MLVGLVTQSLRGNKVKLHNPFVAAEESHSLFLIASIVILVCITGIVFVTTLAMYPIFTLPVVIAATTGRVVYAMINGR